MHEAECLNALMIFVPTFITFGPEHDKSNQLMCAPSEDSDQPGHPPSL